MDSAAARERGNALYKEGRLVEAEAAYKEATTLDPQDPTPVSNLSAVNFELGRYNDAAKLATKALELSSDMPAEKAERLRARRAKCFLHLLKIGDAEIAAGELDSEVQSSQDLIDSVRGTCDLWKSCKQLSISDLWTHLLDRVPRYKARLQDQVEYFPLGHDDPESLFDKDVLKTFNPNDDLACLFCGFGDARNVFATMVTAAMYGLDPRKGQVPWKRIHFTLLDINAGAFARTLIILELLLEYAVIKLTDRSENAGNMSLLVLTYVYSGHILPPIVYERLQSVIERAIKALEMKESDTPWLYVQPSAKPQILRYLRRWQEPVVERFSTANMRKIGLESTQMRNAMTSSFSKHLGNLGNPGNDEQNFPGFAEDKKLFNEFVMIQPPKRYAAKFEPDLAKHISGYLAGEQGSTKDLNNYLDQNWKPNVTLLDLDWDARRMSLQHEGEPIPPPELIINPMEDAGKLLESVAGVPVSSEDTGVVESMEAFWSLVSNALMRLDMMGKMTMEMIHGEMGDVMERLRHNALPHRKAGKDSPVGRDPSSFPSRFNFIHMSNVPDYVGGVVTPLLYGQPILTNDKASSMTFCSLLNCPKFESHEQLAAEYALMPNKDALARHFGARRVGDGSPSGYLQFMMENYWTWKKESAASPRDRLLSRPQLERWLYAHFLKLTLPYPRPPMDPAPVIAPLNLTTFFGLVIRAYEVGYPAHWLSAIIESICSGKIKTTARAPRMVVMNPENAEKVYPSREIDVLPWVTDFAMLLSVWRRLLPFGITAPRNSLVQLDQIDEYSVKFRRFLTPMSLVFGAFMLVFWNCDAGAPPETMRDFLVDDETSSVGRGKRGAIHVLNTFNFVTESMTASFWLRRDLADQMTREGNWKVFIWRTDAWIKEMDGVSVKSGMVRGRNWCAV